MVIKNGVTFSQQSVFHLDLVVNYLCDLVLPLDLLCWVHFERLAWSCFLSVSNLTPQPRSPLGFRRSASATARRQDCLLETVR